MTTTQEIVEWLKIEEQGAEDDDCPIAASRLREAAQRLRELEAQLAEARKQITEADVTDEMDIYILSAGTNYEGASVIAAFHNQADAEELAEKCRQFDKIKPRCPDQDASDDAWGKWVKKEKAWKKKHPAGSDYDYYSVEKAELK